MCKEYKKMFVYLYGVNTYFLYYTAIIDMKWFIQIISSSYNYG